VCEVGICVISPFALLNLRFLCIYGMRSFILNLVTIYPWITSRSFHRRRALQGDFSQDDQSSGSQFIVKKINELVSLIWDGKTFWTTTLIGAESLQQSQQWAWQRAENTLYKVGLKSKPAYCLLLPTNFHSYWKVMICYFWQTYIIHYMKLATGECVVSSPNTVYVTKLPCKILITALSWILLETTPS